MRRLRHCLLRAGWLLAGLAATTPRSPLYAQARWTISEELRIGTKDDGPSSFNDIRGFAVAPDGSILVLDYQTQDIRIFDSRGRYVRTVGRSGSGPGELRNANGMAMVSDGTIWVNDPANSRFAVFAPDGRFLRHHLVPIRSYGFVWVGAGDRLGRLLNPIGVITKSGDYEQAVERISSAGQVLDTLRLTGCPPASQPPSFEARGAGGHSVIQVPFAPRMLRTIDPRGFLWCTPSDKYILFRTDLVKGDTLQVVQSTIAGPPVTEAERAEAIARIRQRLGRTGNASPDLSVIPRTKPAIEGVDVEDGGLLWVRRTTPAGGTTTFDVWDHQGRHVGTAAAPFRVYTYLPVVVRGTTLYAITVDDDGVQFAVRARIAR